MLAAQQHGAAGKGAQRLLKICHEGVCIAWIMARARSWPDQPIVLSSFHGRSQSLLSCVAGSRIDMTLFGLQIVRKLCSESGTLAQSHADTQVEGMAQLRACIWSFDQTKGSVFSTYLWSQLHTRIRQALDGKDTALHVPRRELDLRKRCALLT